MDNFEFCIRCRHFDDDGDGFYCRDCTSYRNTKPTHFEYDNGWQDYDNRKEVIVYDSGDE